MLVIQHIWTRWTQATRGAEAGRMKRPRPEEAYPLPGVHPRSQVFIHEVALIEDFPEFRTIDRSGEISADDWERPQPHRETLWTWKLWRDQINITVRRPYRIQTKFPRNLPAPLFALLPGEIARIDWNGRMAFSLFGSNRSTYYEQQTCWIAHTPATDYPRLFLDAVPRKHIDLRTEIY